MPRRSNLTSRFLFDGLQSLNKTLLTKNSKLFYFKGNPCTLLQQFLLPFYSQQYSKIVVYISNEYTYEEKAVELQLQKLEKEGKISLCAFWNSTILSPTDLPFGSVANLPDVYTNFRKGVESSIGQYNVPKPLPPPSTIPLLPPELPCNVFEDIPDPDSFVKVDDSRTAFPLRGGEANALKRLNYYLSSNSVDKYKVTRNGLVGHEYSTKFSPYLAFGFISARRILKDLFEYEKRVTANDSTYWVWFELLWRDYFKLLALKFGNRIFHRGGLNIRGNSNPRWLENDSLLFHKWCMGQTGIPFVDAAMRELLATGFMSNRARQNVASFLVKDLNIDWTKGAEWFESNLIDHDPCSNYGNWLYVAGLGNDPIEGRRFNIMKQAKDYDRDCRFVLTWCPELQGCTSPHAPWMDRSFQGQGRYPAPAISIPPTWNKHLKAAAS
ncbi:hypothetical protein HDU83_006082 [Entophlyctis luteolus]|nr:hypothetical protein HDU83_006082 [Entophlyctis luteolus]